MFKIEKYLGGRGAYPDPVEIPVTAGASFMPGQALVLDGGVGKLATGDVKVAFVSTMKLTAEDSTAGKKLLCYKVDGNTVFRAPLSAYGSTVTVGAALTVASTGDGITATAASTGGAKVLDTLGAAAAGDCILVSLA